MASALLKSLRITSKTSLLPILSSKVPDQKRNYICQANARTQKLLSYQKDFGSYHAQIRNYSFQEFYIDYLTVKNPAIQQAVGLLEGIHDFTCLPWWASIPVSVFIIRSCITLPLLIHSTKNAVKLKKLEPEIKEISAQLNTEVNVARAKYEWNDHQSRMQFHVNMKRLVNDLYIRDNCHPGKPIALGLIQIPLWVVLSLAFRNMAGAFRMIDIPGVTPSMKTEGALWFSDLTAVDDTFILPIAFLLINCTIMEITILRMNEPGNKKNLLQKVYRPVILTVNLMIFMIATLMPSCMAYYWMWSSCYGLVCNLALRSLKVKKVLGIPLMPNESKHPYKDMIKQFKDSMFIVKKDK